jgi:hypothetical protein
MIRLSKNNLSDELKNELNRLSTIGDLIGGVDKYENLPTTNTDISGTGISIIGTVSKIKSHDIIIVSDATSVNKGRNAMYEAASASDEDAAALTWTFVMNMIVPLPKRHLALTTNVPAIMGSSGTPTVTNEVKTIWTNDHLDVEVYVNGLHEAGFEINSDNEIVLIGYPSTGWTGADTVEVYYWKNT